MDPLRVHGSEISYFTGKLEAYLRFKEIPYTLVPCVPDRLRKQTGTAQIPAVELADGRWLTDTTPIIAWLETQIPDPPVIPRDPLQGWFSRLLEDHADEWLWRPALHYRWSYAADRVLLSRRIAEELARDIPVPGPLKRALVRARQRLVYVRGDGIREATRAHVESIYRDTLAHLRAILSERPFLLGEVPTLADFGFFASMFRHFGLDPTPSRIMRETAPEVYEWLARLWNARASRTRGSLVPGVPDDWGPLLDAVAHQYLPHLCANAQAWSDGRRRFDVEIEGVRYERLRTSRYRVWCLEKLREHFEALPEPVRETARARLEKHGCWEPLWRVQGRTSGVDPEGRAPFGGSASMLGIPGSG